MIIVALSSIRLSVLETFVRLRRPLSLRRLRLAVRPHHTTPPTTTTVRASGEQRTLFVVALYTSSSCAARHRPTPTPRVDHCSPRPARPIAARLLFLRLRLSSLLRLCRRSHPLSRVDERGHARRPRRQRHTAMHSDGRSGSAAASPSVLCSLVAAAAALLPLSARRGACIRTIM